jgi:glycosyltransferase involved in cell wall biosynthesis
MPLISIIIPLYNKERFIKETLDSVFNQTFLDYELIIINDGSTDKSCEIVKSICKNKKNIILISQENQGLSSTRNKGIRLAKGEIIALLDADDLWNKNYLKEIHKLYNDFPEASLYGTDYIEKLSSTIELEPSKNISGKLKNSTFLIEDFFRASLFQPIVNPSCFCFKKEVFKTVKFNESINFGEDVDYFINSNLNFSFAYSYKPLATVNLNIPNQITQLGFKGKRLPDFDQFEKYTSQKNSLKKYIDTKRYFLLIQCRMLNDKENYLILRKSLNLSNLNSRQKFLLQTPLIILKFLKKIKKIGLRYRVRITSF